MTEIILCAAGCVDVCCRLPQGGVRAMGTSGEEVEVRQTPDMTQLRQDLQVSTNRTPGGGGKSWGLLQACVCMWGGGG